MTNHSNLQGKVALITGANAGIGAAIAKELAGAGAAVVLHFLEEQPDAPAEGVTREHTVYGREAARKVQEEIRSRGGQAALAAGNLADPSAVPALFDRAEEAFGTVDILVNNAAHCELPDTVRETTAGSIDRHFAVNARAAVLLIRELAARIEKAGTRFGRVINISTDAAQAFPSQISYGASKAALEAYTRSLAVELGPLGITVNAIAPGPVQTGWITPEQEETLRSSIPLGRVGTPQDIAHAVAFFASAEAGWITGQVLRVAGGHAL